MANTPFILGDLDQLSPQRGVGARLLDLQAPGNRNRERQPRGDDPRVRHTLRDAEHIDRELRIIPPSGVLGRRMCDTGAQTHEPQVGIEDEGNDLGFGEADSIRRVIVGRDDVPFGQPVGECQHAFAVR